MPRLIFSQSQRGFFWVSKKCLEEAAVPQNTPQRRSSAGFASFFCEYFSLHFAQSLLVAISWHTDCEVIPVISYINVKFSPLFLRALGIIFVPISPLVCQAKVKSRRIKIFLVQGRKTTKQQQQQQKHHQTQKAPPTRTTTKPNKGVFPVTFYLKAEREKSRGCHLLGETREDTRASNAGSTWWELSNVGLILGVNDISVWPMISSFSPNNLVSTNIKNTWS